MYRSVVLIGALLASCDSVRAGAVGSKCLNDRNCLPGLACIEGECTLAPEDAGRRRDAGLAEAGLLDAEVEDAGDPVDSGVVDTGPICPVPPELDQIQTNIFGSNGQPNCNQASCHGQSAAGGVQLTVPVAQLREVLLGDTRDLAAPQRKLVVPGDPEESRLYIIISTRTPGGNGGPMPPGMTLDACDISTVRRWIEAGAL